MLSQINKKQRETVKKLLSKSMMKGARFAFVCVHSRDEKNARLKGSPRHVEGISSIDEWNSSSEMDIMILLSNYYFRESFVITLNWKKFIVVEVFPACNLCCYNCQRCFLNFESLERVSQKHCYLYFTESVNKDTLIIIKRDIENVFVTLSRDDRSLLKI